MRSMLLLAFAASFALSAMAFAEDAGVEPRALVRIESFRRDPQQVQGPVLGLIAHDDLYLLGAIEETRAWNETDEIRAEFDSVLPWLEEVLGAERILALGDEVFYVPGAAASDRRTELARLAVDVARRIEVDVEVIRADGTRTTGQIQVATGGRGNFQRVTGRDVVADYGVEIAGDGNMPSAMGNPVVARVFDGVSVDVRAYDIEPGGRIALEAICQTGAFAPARVETTHIHRLGTFDRTAYRGALACVSGRAMPNETIESRVALGDDTYTVRLTPRRTGPQPATGKRGTLRCYDLSFFALDSWFALPRPEEGDHDPQLMRPGVAFMAPLAAPAFVAETLVSRAPRAKFALDANGRLFVGASLADQRAVRDLIAELGRSTATAVVIELELRAGSERIASVRLPALDGRPASARIGIDRRFLRDVDAEVA